MDNVNLLKARLHQAREIEKREKETSREKKITETAQKALESIQAGKTLTNHSRAREFAAEIAECRYRKRHGVEGLSIAAAAHLAAHGTLQGWAAILARQDIHENAITYLKSKSFDFLHCATFWKRLQTDNSKWAPWLLLGMKARQTSKTLLSKQTTTYRVKEMLHEAWKGNAEVLIDGLACLRVGGPLPIPAETMDRPQTKRRKLGRNESLSSKPLDQYTQAPAKSEVVDLLAPSSSGGLLTTAQLLEDNLDLANGLENTSRNNDSATTDQTSIKAKRLRILDYVKRQDLQREERHVTRRNIDNMTDECISDLYRSIFYEVGAKRADIENVLHDLREALDSAEVHQVEKALNLSLSVQASADMEDHGDFELKFKVSRISGVSLLHQYRLPIHNKATPPIQQDQ